MHRILIVSPHFPPVDTADMHRVRMSAPHFARHGWDPWVLTIDPRHVSASRDDELVERLPQDLRITRVPAFPASLARLLGVGDAAIRAYPQLLLAGLRIIREQKIDLVYFSTTQFFAFTLGRIWKTLTGVPLVFDIQDPWVNDYVARGGAGSTGFKRRLARRIHARLEARTMPWADGLISVSQRYIDEILKRHPPLVGRPYCVLPFGVSPDDFDLHESRPRENRLFDVSDGKTHGVYVGRGGVDMHRALGIVFSALRSGLERSPQLFARVRLHFVGTDYAPPARSRESVMPLAREYGVAEFVREKPERIPYFDAIELLKQASFLLVPGSDDPRYNASKIVPYLYASKPLLAVFNEQSPVVTMLEDCARTGLVRFAATTSEDVAARKLVHAWELCLQTPEKLVPSRQSSLRPYYSDVLSERQCRLFDEVCSATFPGRTLKRDRGVTA